MDMESGYSSNEAHILRVVRIYGNFFCQKHMWHGCATHALYLTDMGMESGHDLNEAHILRVVRIYGTFFCQKQIQSANDGLK
jgi:hypothetical protein